MLKSSTQGVSKYALDTPITLFGTRSLEMQNIVGFLFSNANIPPYCLQSTRL